MTEAEWLNETDPQKLVSFVGRFRPSERKLRLYATAGCRRIWHLLRDERSRTAVEVAEQFADGHVTEDARDRACTAADEATTDLWLATEENERGAVSNWDSANLSVSTACNAVGPTEDFVGAEAELFYLAANPIEARMLEVREHGHNGDATLAAERVIHLALLHDIFGNPFRPVSLAPAWLTSDVLLLARGIYNEKAFDRMPILADALQDAGCDNPDVLNHCRDTNQVHVRGCWVLDLVLGKS